ncbi:hypothetical protein SAMN02745746_03009 [Pseudogulbenkiania subflava DSM 22618]|uniref:Uncharacterized protein n=1 Tax=Pseudogulbenkiania subflava DSM 22618 TaxID=1123014 RepID=A0A1Y6C3J0_9NEIS|nr:hypothetical protein SAMN02745746_03009 [Pseudogulbenkiania subflava DSM 22618]
MNQGMWMMLAILVFAGAVTWYADTHRAEDDDQPKEKEDHI